MEQFNDMRNVRMPRACKRTRVGQTEIKAVRTSGRSQALANLIEEQDNQGNTEPAQNVTINYTTIGCIPSPMQQPSITYGRTPIRTPGRSQALANLIEEQDNRRYTEPAQGATIHYTTTGCITAPRQQSPITYGRAPKRQQMESPELSNNMLQNHPRARYPTAESSQQDSLPYSKTTQNFGQRNPNVSQVLYPNMMQAPRSTAPCSVTDPYSTLKQIPQAATATEQQGSGNRYNTRRSVHNLNLPLSTAHDITNYWNCTNKSNPGSSSTLSETQNVPSTIHTKQQSTPKQKSCPELKNMESQTDLKLTDDEADLITTLRAKRMDIKKLNFMIENDQYKVTYNDETRIETVNNLMRTSQDFKISLMTKYFEMSCMNMSGSIPHINPAITYPASADNNASNDDERASTSGQQSSVTLLQSLLGEAVGLGGGVPPANAPNNDSTSDFEEATPPQLLQVPQRKATRQGNPSVPIPTVRGPLNNYRTYPPYRYPGRLQMRPPFNPHHIFRNFNPRLAMEANMYPQMHSPEIFPQMHAQEIFPQMHSSELFGYPGWFYK